MPKKKTSKKISARGGSASGGKKLSNQITKLLDAAKIKYNLLEHRVVYTAHDVGATTKKKLGEIAKVVLVKVEGSHTPVIASPEVRKGRGNLVQKIASDALAMTKKAKYLALIVVPAGKYIDLAGIKKALKAKKVSIASEKDITKYLKTKVGLLHPFGQLYKINTLLDKGLAKSKKIIASAGSYTHSVELGLKDFEKLTQPIKGVFAKKNR